MCVCVSTDRDVCLGLSVDEGWEVSRHSDVAGVASDGKILAETACPWTKRNKSCRKAVTLICSNQIDWLYFLCTSQWYWARGSTSALNWLYTQTILYFSFHSDFDSCRSSVQFSPLTDWVVGGTWGSIQQRSSSSLFCRRPLWAALAWAGMSSLWCCLSSISSADHRRCLQEWFWIGCRDEWHARTVHVSVSLQLPEEVPVDPQGSWSCSTPSRWSCTPSRRCGEVSSGT